MNLYKFRVLTSAPGYYGAGLQPQRAACAEAQVPKIIAPDASTAATLARQRYGEGYGIDQEPVGPASDEEAASYEPPYVESAVRAA